MISARTYPEWLEAWWVRQAQQRAQKSNADDAVTVHTEAVQALSDMFTIDRPAGTRMGKAYFPDYGADAKLAVAYGLFYFPQNYTRARLPLAEAIELRGWRPQAAGETRPVRVLDLGAGAGATGLGVARLLQEHGLAENVELTAVDHSADQLARLATLARDNAEHLPGLRVRTVAQAVLDWTERELVREKEPYDLVVIGYALNEMLPAELKLGPRLELIQRLRRKLTANGLVLILEPSLRETAEPLQELSDVLCDRAGTTHGPMMKRWGPYLSDRRCPLRAEKKFWNHEVRRWTAPTSLKLLNRKLWREIDDVKFAYALHGNAPAPALPEAYATAMTAADGMVVRLVSPFHLRKGGFVAAAVNTEGKKITLDLQVRGLEKDEIARLESIERGDVLALRELKELGTPGLWRLANPAAMVARYHPE